MICQEARALQHAYADDEVDVLRATELEEHLRGCPACRATAQNIRTLRSTFKSAALAYKAPAQLKKDVRAMIRAECRQGAGFWPFSWSWLRIMAPAAAGALATGALIMSLHGPANRDGLAQEVVSSHVRSLMAGHLTDVASSDQHTVKPWFTGKLDFAPRVVDLAAQGFPLVGGRLDYLGNRSVAALVYERGKHRINVFIWPAREAQSNPKWTARHGYNLVEWTQGGLTYWAVSDLNGTELSELARLIQSSQ